MGSREDLHAERVDWSDHHRLELSPHFRRTCRSFDLRQESCKYVRFKLNFFKKRQIIVKPRLRYIMYFVFARQARTKGYPTIHLSKFQTVKREINEANNGCFTVIDKFNDNVIVARYSQGLLTILKVA